MYLPTPSHLFHLASQSQHPNTVALHSLTTLLIPKIKRPIKTGQKRRREDRNPRLRILNHKPLRPLHALRRPRRAQIAHTTPTLQERDVVKPILNPLQPQTLTRIQTRVVVLIHDADVLNARIRVRGHGARRVVPGDCAGGADDGVRAALQDEHGAAEGAATDAVVAREGDCGLGRGPRRVAVDVGGVEGGEGGVAGVVAAADALDVAEGLEWDRVEDCDQIEAVEVRDGEGEEGGEDGVSDRRGVADWEGGWRGGDGAEEAGDGGGGLPLGDGPCYTATFGVAERDPFGGEFGEGGLRGDNAVDDVVGVQLVREVVEELVGAEADVVGDHDGVAEAGEGEDAAEVVLEVARVGDGALARDA